MTAASMLIRGKPASKFPVVAPIAIGILCAIGTHGAVTISLAVVMVLINRRSKQRDRAIERFTTVFPIGFAIRLREE